MFPDDLDGKDAIELGCGTAYGSAVDGAARRAAGRDRQLGGAARHGPGAPGQHGLVFPLLHGNAEEVPLPDESFDFALSEYGASIWADPYKWIPEAARLLRPGGRLSFLVNAPLLMLCVPDEEGPGRRDPEADLLRHAPLRVARRRLRGVPPAARRDDPPAARHRLRGGGTGRAPAGGGRDDAYHFVTLEWARPLAIGGGLEGPTAGADPEPFRRCVRRLGHGAARLLVGTRRLAGGMRRCGGRDGRRRRAPAEDRGVQLAGLRDGAARRPHRLFVVEQAGRSASCATAGSSRSRSSTSARRSSRRRAGPALAGVRARLRQAGASTSTTPTGRRPRIVEYRRAARRRAPTRHRAAACCVQRQPEPNHNGGLLLFGPDKLLYIGIGDGGGGGDQHGARQRPEPRSCSGKILRIDPRRRRPAVHDPGVQPVRRAGRGARRDLRLRPPQPVALLVRPPTGDLTIGDVGQDASRRSTSRAAGGRAARTTAGACSRATHALHAGESAPGAVAPVITSALRRQLLDHRRLRRPRPALPALRGRYVFGDYCHGRIESARLRGRRRARVPRRVEGAAGCRRSARTRRGRVYAMSLNGPVYRLAPAAERVADLGIAPRAGSEPEPFDAHGHEHLAGRPRPVLGRRPGAGGARAPRRRRGRGRGARRRGRHRRDPRPRGPRGGRGRCPSGGRPVGAPAAPTRRRRRHVRAVLAWSRRPAMPTTTSCSSRARRAGSPVTRSSARAASSSPPTRLAARATSPPSSACGRDGARDPLPRPRPPLVLDADAKLDEYLAHRRDRERKLERCARRRPPDDRRAARTPAGNDQTVPLRRRRRRDRHAGGPPRQARRGGPLRSRCSS